MTLRPLAPLVCPACGAARSLYVAQDNHLTCRICGHKLPQTDDQISTPTATSPSETWRRYPITYGRMYHEPLDPWASSAYNTGLTALEHDQPEAAIVAFRRALDTEPNFLDAHLWLARLLSTTAEKRQHYSEVVASLPNHLEAIQELMVLNGTLTREETNRLQQGGGTSVHVNVPVEAQAHDTECPVCGGAMHTHTDGSSECQQCAYRRAAPSGGDYGMKSFTMEVLKRHGQKTQWEVGERLLRCDNCGAETLLLAQALTVVCPFCASASVIETDALRSFVQPDGLLTFSVDEASARARLEAALNSSFEKFKGFFINNRVTDVRVTGVYLPFWLYDISLQISKKTQERSPSLYGDLGVSYNYRDETLWDSAFDVPVCGVESPPRRLTERLPPYDLSQLHPYHPDLLAGATAELYTVDFERASSLARRRATEVMRQRHGNSSGDKVKVIIQSMVQMMQFRLVLLPAWVFHLTESDGDLRSALVHGQSGRVVLGSATRHR